VGSGIPTALGRLRVDGEAIADFDVVNRRQRRISVRVAFCAAHVESLERDWAYGAMAGTNSLIFGRLNRTVAVLAGPVGSDQFPCNRYKVRLAPVCTYILCADCIVILLLVNCFLGVRDGD
jgi:hypothetical protein